MRQQVGRRFQSDQGQIVGGYAPALFPADAGHPQAECDVSGNGQPREEVGVLKDDATCGSGFV